MFHVSLSPPPPPPCKMLDLPYLVYISAIVWTSQLHTGRHCKAFEQEKHI